MLIARIFGGLLLIVLGMSGVMYLATRDRRWLRFAAQTLRIGALILLILFALYLLERFLLVI